MDCPKASTASEDSVGSAPTRSVADILAAASRDGSMSVWAIVPEPSSTMTFAETFWAFAAWSTAGVLAPGRRGSRKLGKSEHPLRATRHQTTTATDHHRLRMSAPRPCPI